MLGGEHRERLDAVEERNCVDSRPAPRKSGRAHVQIVAQALDAGDTPNDAVDRPLVGGALHESARYLVRRRVLVRADDEAALSLWGWPRRSLHSQLTPRHTAPRGRGLSLPAGLGEPVPDVKNEHPLVYIVDDDLAVREALRSMIRSVGMRCETFASADEFLRHSRADGPACLVL